MNNEDILLYFERLQNHDWFYFYSDDSNVNTRGLISEHEIRRLAILNDLFKRMYDDYYDAVFHNKKKPCLKDYLK